MCGIAGLMVRGGAPASDLSARLAQALHHRGPDGSGEHRRDNMLLVHTRLSIVDLAGGKQPLMASDGVALIANAEIYNDPDLRRQLPAADYVTGSDCESALHLYRRDGETFARGLRGMYAIAVHDPAKKRLLLARDPFGIKPLYYAETAQGFAFASEPQALTQSGLVAPRIDPSSRDELLAMQFTTGTATPFAGITRVRPGETLVVENGRIVARHVQPALPPPGHDAYDEQSALTAFAGIWRDSVHVHQRADVAYGMFLSGGIDSSAVLTMMAELNSKPVLAFTAAFPGTAAPDERAEARAVAKACKAEHVEVEITAADFWRALPDIAAAMDDPAADYAVVPTYLLGEKARGHVKVVLTGEGGDELFGGYGRYRSATRPWPFTRKPWRHHALDGLLRDMPPHWRAGLNRIEAETAAAGYGSLQKAQAVDCAAWLPNDLLTKLDRCLMVHGIEGRVPFLDPKVAAFAFRLPDRLKVSGGQGKTLLRRWLAETCPAASAFARKRGFTVPVAQWIAAESLRLAPLVARQPGVAELCKPGAVEALFRRTAGGQAAWLLLFYALWHRRHMLGLKADGDVFDTLAAT